MTTNQVVAFLLFAIVAAGTPGPKLIRFEKHVENYLGLVHFACCLIVYRLTVLG